MRSIDDCYKSGFNCATQAVEKLRLEVLEALVAAARVGMRVFGTCKGVLPVFASGDHEKAYRQWTACTEDCPRVVALLCDRVKERFRIYAHAALPLSVFAAVW